MKKAVKVLVLVATLIVAIPATVPATVVVAPVLRPVTPFGSLRGKESPGGVRRFFVDCGGGAKEVAVDKIAVTLYPQGWGQPELAPGQSGCITQPDGTTLVHVGTEAEYSAKLVGNIIDAAGHRAELRGMNALTYFFSTGPKTW